MSEKVQWFSCPGCLQMVPGVVRETGPENTDQISSTHCCVLCETGDGHDHVWCAGVPASSLRESSISTGPPGRFAHYILHEPDWSTVCAPVPALLLLHGALTYLWPETLWQEVKSLFTSNAISNDFVIIAPIASKSEPLAVRSSYRTKQDRFGKYMPYVDTFEPNLTWECFIKACHELGDDKVDFERLCVTGFSMGAQAAWDLALTKGSRLAAFAPMAGCCDWPCNAWEHKEFMASQSGNLPLRSYHIQSDHPSYSVRDFVWLAGQANLPEIPEERGSVVRCLELPIELVTKAWDDDLQLILLTIGDETHNCWDVVYRNEADFGLMAWLAEQRNESAPALIMKDQDDVGSLVIRRLHDVSTLVPEYMLLTDEVEETAELPSPTAGIDID